MPTPTENAAMVARMRTEPLRRWSGFTIHLTCQGCREERQVTVASLLSQHGDRLVGDVVARFRCAVCGREPERVEFRHHVARWVVRGEWSD